MNLRTCQYHGETDFFVSGNKQQCKICKRDIAAKWKAAKKAKNDVGYCSEDVRWSLKYRKADSPEILRARVWAVDAKAAEARIQRHIGARIISCRKVEPTNESNG